MPKAKEELCSKLKSVVDHIDRPQSHFGLGPEHEGYGRNDAFETILLQVDTYLASTLREVLSRLPEKRPTNDAQAKYIVSNGISWDEGQRNTGHNQALSEVEDVIQSVLREINHG
jgi:hypothetical protein